MNNTNNLQLVDGYDLKYKLIKLERYIKHLFVHHILHVLYKTRYKICRNFY